MQRQTLAETDGIFFTLEDVAVTPATPMQNELVIVFGKVKLFKIPFIAPIWVIATVTAPETLWEHYIPIWGAPEIRERDTALGGDFEIIFKKGFDREGEYSLAVRAYAGPTIPIDTMTLPPFPPVATEETTFVVSGEAPPEEANFRSFRITGYAADTGVPVEPPDILKLQVGDRCRVHVAYEHREASVTAKFHAAIWQPTLIDPHDEVLNAEKAFTVPETPSWDDFVGSIDIPITSAIADGLYGVYVKIMGVTGGDIFTEYLASVIQIGEAPPPEADIKDFDFTVTKGTYKIGDKVPFTAPYAYKGPAQNGQLTISIGTGVYPTFNTVYTYTPLSVVFAAATDWATLGLQGNITLPSGLQAGQTYSVRAKLETLTAPTQETDTDWLAFDIAAGPPTSDIRNFDFVPQGGTYDLGDSVPFTGPYEYKGIAQSGRLTISLGTGVSPTFSTKYTYPPIAVTFNEAIDWIGGTVSGSFKLPTTLEPGQTYSVRAKLEALTQPTQETDTDWGVLTITAPPEEYKGTISKKELEYNETHQAIPVSNIPIGKRGLVHIWGRNDTSKTQQRGIEWTVKDPQGNVRENYSTWEALPYAGPGVSKEFIGGRFNLDREGVWTINVNLLMNKPSPVTVASYGGNLATVVSIPVGIAFAMTLWGTGGFGAADKWMCYYWDPGRNNYVGDQKWYRLYEAIPFSGVQSGGYVAVFLLKDSTVSPQFTSPAFSAVDGGVYQFDIDLGRITKIG